MQIYREPDKSRLYISDRKQSRKEERRHPYAVIICHPVLGEIFVPSVQLIPLHQLSYLRIVCKIIDANPTKMFSRFVLEELWEAILANVYAYEYKEHKWREEKKSEVRVSSNHEGMLLTLATVL